jgi:hypothetical protein
VGIEPRNIFVTVTVTVTVTENQPVDWSFGDGRTHYLEGPLPRTMRHFLEPGLSP